MPPLGSQTNLTCQLPRNRQAPFTQRGHISQECINPSGEGLFPGQGSSSCHTALGQGTAFSASRSLQLHSPNPYVPERRAHVPPSAAAQDSGPIPTVFLPCSLLPCTIFPPFLVGTKAVVLCNRPTLNLGQLSKQQQQTSPNKLHSCFGEPTQCWTRHGRAVRVRIPTQLISNLGPVSVA